MKTLIYLIVGCCFVCNHIFANRVEDTVNVLRSNDVKDQSTFDDIDSFPRLEYRMNSMMNKDTGMKPLEKKLKNIGKSLLKNEADDVELDSGVQKSKKGGWDVQFREKVAKHHKDGIKSYKAGVAQVKDKKDEPKHAKAHEVRKIAVSASGSDPQAEKNGNFFRSVEKTQMVQKSWEAKTESNGTSRASFPSFPMSQSFGERFMPRFPFVASSNFERMKRLDDLISKAELDDETPEEKFKRQFDEAMEEYQAKNGGMLLRNNAAAPSGLKQQRRRSRDESTAPFWDALNDAASASKHAVFRRRPSFFLH